MPDNPYITRLERFIVDRELSNAAAAAGGTSHVVSQLRESAKVVTDGAGEIRVVVGNSLLSPDEAVLALRDSSEHSNLFPRSRDQGSRDQESPPADYEGYRRWRKSHKP